MVAHLNFPSAPLRLAFAKGQRPLGVTLRCCRKKVVFSSSRWIHSTLDDTAASFVATQQQQQRLKERPTRSFQTWSPSKGKKKNPSSAPLKPGALAFADSEIDAIVDLFYRFAASSPSENGSPSGGVDENGNRYLCVDGVRDLLASIGEKPSEETLNQLFDEADANGDRKLHLKEFLVGSDKVLGGAPARIVLVVGGPGSGKGILCDRLVEECGIVHLSSGDLLRDEVKRGTPLGHECAAIMKRGDLVSSAVIMALLRRRMRAFPGRRVLLDGFPRSLENAHDFVEICGKPELALHLDCEDTVLMERIIKRARENAANGTTRADDNVDTALQRLRTFHKYHRPTIEWLREQRVPIVNLDCSGTPDNVWEQLLAIGRLMRPAAKFKDDFVEVKQELFKQELQGGKDDEDIPTNQPLQA